MEQLEQPPKHVPTIWDLLEDHTQATDDHFRHLAQIGFETQAERLHMELYIIRSDHD